MENCFTLLHASARHAGRDDRRKIPVLFVRNLVECWEEEDGREGPKLGLHATRDGGGWGRGGRLSGEGRRRRGRRLPVAVWLQEVGGGGCERGAAGVVVGGLRCGPGGGGGVGGGGDDVIVGELGEVDGEVEVNFPGVWYRVFCPYRCRTSRFVSGWLAMVRVARLLCISDSVHHSKTCSGQLLPSGGRSVL